jgi:hypothetical protein
MDIVEFDVERSFGLSQVLQPQRRVVQVVNVELGVHLHSETKDCFALLLVAVQEGKCTWIHPEHY